MSLGGITIMPRASEFTSTAGMPTCAAHHDAVIVIDAACAIAITIEKQLRFASRPSHQPLGICPRLVGSLFAAVPTTGQLMPRPMEWRIVWENRRPTLAFDSPLCDLLACCIGCTITILCWSAFCTRSSRRRSGLARAFTMLLLLQGGAWFLPAAEAARLDNALAAEAVAEAAHALDGDDALGSSSALAVAGRRLQTTTTVSTIAELRAAVEDSSVGTILVAAGTYTFGDGHTSSSCTYKTYSALCIKRSVRIEAVGDVVLKAQGDGGTASRRVLEVETQAGDTVAIVNLQIKNGYVSEPKRYVIYGGRPL